VGKLTSLFSVINIFVTILTKLSYFNSKKQAIYLYYDFPSAFVICNIYWSEICLLWSKIRAFDLRLNPEISNLYELEYMHCRYFLILIYTYVILRGVFLYNILSKSITTKVKRQEIFASLEKQYIDFGLKSNILRLSPILNDPLYIRIFIFFLCFARCKN